MRRTAPICALCATSPVCLKWLSSSSEFTRRRLGSMERTVSHAVHGSTASRRRRIFTTHWDKDARELQARWSPARHFFGSWKVVAADTKYSLNDAGSSSKASLTSPANQAAAAAVAVDAAAAESEIKLLREQIVDLKEALEASQETVKQLLVLTSTQKVSGAAASTATATVGPCDSPGSPCGPCAGTTQVAKSVHGACYVVRTSEELVDALRGRGSEHASRTIILDGKLFLLDMYAQIEVDQARVYVVGNHATVIGHIAVKGRGAVLAVSDTFFLCPYDLELRPTDSSNTEADISPATTVNETGKREEENVAQLMPVISATAGAGVHLDRCVLSNGRDGVYLGMGSHCTLNHVRIANCIRGLYEGVGCRASMVDTCTFQANRYHVVLLGPDGAKRASRLFCQLQPPNAYGPAFTASFSPTATAADVLAPGVTTASVIALQQNKAQVVLQHNPITDIYEDCWVDGQKVELSAADATAGLSDPLF